jgi:invasion protein IalB
MSKQTGWTFRIAVSVLAAIGVVGFAGTDALAQKAKKKTVQRQSAWVKLCEKTTLRRMDKKGKLQDVTKDICLTHHERLDGRTGSVVVSAAIRQVDNEKRPSLMIMVPLGMAIPPGVKAAVYTKDQWQRASKKQKVSDKELKPISLKFTLCHPAGCTAEVPAPDGLVKSMETGGGLMVLALNAAGRPVAFPVPLVGFKEAHEGKPIDSRKYGLARARLMASIRERAKERYIKEHTGGKLPEPQPIKKK